MKVICVINRMGLYKGEIYEVIGDIGISHVVITDNGVVFLHPKKYFITLEEYRERQLNKIL